MSKLDEMRSLGPPGAARQYIPSGGRVATEAEIAALREKLADGVTRKVVTKKGRGRGRPKIARPATMAERARKYRQRKKAK